MRKLSAFLRALRASVVNRFLIFYLCVSAPLREERRSLAKALSRRERIKGRIFYHPLRWRHRGHGVLKEGWRCIWRKLSAFLRALRGSVVNRFFFFNFASPRLCERKEGLSLSRQGAKKSLFFHHPLRWRHRGHRVLKEEAGMPGENFQPFSVPPW